MRISYFINQYPKVSHSFIRREIQALEKQGIVVQRIAVRGRDAELVDAADKEEQDKTGYVLADGAGAILFSVFKVVLKSPLRFFKAMRLAIRLGKNADRSWPFHLIYLAEACHILPKLRKFGSMHVHAHFGTNSAEVVLLAHTLGGPPYSFTVHGPEEFDKPLSIHLGEKIQHASFVVAISSFGRSQLYRWVQEEHWQKIQVVHCGIDQAFYDLEIPAIPRSRRLVCVGRLCEQKGQLLLIEAIHLLVNKGIELQLVLAGDGEMRAEVEALIARYNLRNSVEITGWISSERVRDEILGARGLVLPSFAEGLPVVIMEAFALQRPVITTYVAGIPELVHSGENGWLVTPGSVDALAEAIEDFLGQPDEVLRKMGRQGSVRVKERHNIDTEAAKLAKLFGDSCLRH